MTTVNTPLLFKGLIEEISFDKLLGTEHINYHFGDEHELKTYLDLFKTMSGKKLKDAIKQFGSYKLALSNGLDTQPYPLVWLKKINNGNPTVEYFDRRGNQQKISNIQLFIIQDTECKVLNTVRWRDQMPMLNDIANLIVKKLTVSNTTQIIGRFPKIKEYSNFHNVADCDTRWDAVVLEFDLIVNNKCFLNKNYAFCK